MNKLKKMFWMRGLFTTLFLVVMALGVRFAASDSQEWTRPLDVSVFNNLTDFTQNLTDGGVCVYNATNDLLECDYLYLSNGSVNVSLNSSYARRDLHNTFEENNNFSKNVTVSGSLGVYGDGSFANVDAGIMLTANIINAVTWQRQFGDITLDAQNPADTRVFVRNNFLGSYSASLDVEGNVTAGSVVCDGFGNCLNTVHNMTNVCFVNNSNTFTQTQHVRSLIPVSDSAYELGSSSSYWDTTYSDDVSLDSSGRILVRGSLAVKGYELLAGDGACLITGGCNKSQFEYSDVNMVEMVFPPEEETCADWVVVPPLNYDRRSVVFQLVWNTHYEGSVVWCVSSQARTHGELKSSSFGDPVCVESSSLSTADTYIFSTEETVAAAYNAEVAPVYVFRVCRSEEDSLKEDARLIAAYLKFDELQYNDKDSGVP